MFYILTIALLLRLILINQSLWLDEAIQALALMGRMGPLFTYALADFQPPLYHGLGWLWTQFFGYSELALRGPSLLAGLGTVYFVAKIAELLGGKKLAIIAGTLAATNPLLIYYSQEGRTYGLTTFFVTAAIYYFIKVYQNTTKSKKYPIYYILYTTLYLWTSYLTWFLHLLIFVYSLIKKRKDLVISQIISGATLLLWLPSLLSSLSIGLSTVSHSPEWGSVVGGISLKALALTWIKGNLGRISFDNDYYYAAIVICLFLLHLYIFAKQKLLPNTKTTYTLLLTWLSTLILAAVFALILPIYSYTRVLFVLPAYLLLLSLALSSQTKVLTYLVVLAQLSALAYFWVNPVFHKEAWRQLVQDYGPSATYALPSLSQNAPLLYYGVEEAEMLEPKLGLVSRPNEIIYIKYVEDIFDTQKLGVKELIEAGYTLSSQRVYPGLQVDLYENNN